MNTNGPQNNDHSQSSPKTRDGQEADTGFPGIVAALGQLGAGTLINEKGLALLLSCHPMTIRRAVIRSELPVPVRMFGKPTWTVGAIVRHVEARLEEAAREARILAQNRT